MLGPVEKRLHHGNHLDRAPTVSTLPLVFVAWSNTDGWKLHGTSPAQKASAAFRGKYFQLKTPNAARSDEGRVSQDYPNERHSAAEASIL